MKAILAEQSAIKEVLALLNTGGGESEHLATTPLSSAIAMPMANAIVAQPMRGQGAYASAFSSGEHESAVRDQVRPSSAGVMVPWRSGVPTQQFQDEGEDEVGGGQSVADMVDGLLKRGEDSFKFQWSCVCMVAACAGLYLGLSTTFAEMPDWSCNVVDLCACVCACWSCYMFLV